MIQFLFYMCVLFFFLAVFLLLDAGCRAGDASIIYDGVRALIERLKDWPPGGSAHLNKKGYRGGGTRIELIGGGFLVFRPGLKCISKKVFAETRIEKVRIRI